MLGRDDKHSLSWQILIFYVLYTKTIKIDSQTWVHTGHIKDVSPIPQLPEYLVSCVKIEGKGVLNNILGPKMADQ